MHVTNEHIDKGWGNGTLCRRVGVKLQSRDKHKWKNLEGKKVYTTSIDNVKWVKFEQFLSIPKNTAREITLEV